jgi:proline iminopeptidase
MGAPLPADSLAAREGYIPVDHAHLYYREVGRGQPMIVLHGGPDFDHRYLLPELDRLADSFHLIYYDQRGRGLSRAHVRPDEVSLQSEITDLDAVRVHFQLEAVAVLGHSWGGVLALEYALRHPQHVSHLLLMNTAPVSHADLVMFQQARLCDAAEDMRQLRILAATAAYQAGDLQADAAYYRVHFRAAIRDAEQLEQVVTRLRANQTPDGILKARAIEQRLYEQTWLRHDYNLLPKLAQLGMPALVVHGEDDFIPVACAVHIAQALPEARLIVLPGCGHFSYLECPEAAHQTVRDFFRR